jgi:hypothetical protein
MKPAALLTRLEKGEIMSDVKNMTGQSDLERYAVRYRAPHPKPSGIHYLRATSIVDAMAKAEEYCRKAGLELQSVLQDPQD